MKYEWKEGEWEITKEYEKDSQQKFSQRVEIKEINTHQSKAISGKHQKAYQIHDRAEGRLWPGKKLLHQL